MYPPRIQLGILDNHPLVLNGLASVFADCSDVDVRGKFDDSNELLRRLPEMQVDVLVMEFLLDECTPDSAELITGLIRRYPGLKIMIFSASQDTGIATWALRLGARGYVCKSADPATIIGAVRQIHRGRRYIDPSMNHLLPDSLLPERSTAAPYARSGNRFQTLMDSARLSPSERIVVKGFVAGANVMEIASRLHKSPKTISTQKAAAFRKLGVSSDSGLYRLVSSAAEPR